MQVLSGFTKDTALNLQLNAGILVKNHEVGSKIDDNNKLGATEGGSTFAAVPTMRNIFEGIDDARGDYMDGNVIDTIIVTLTASISEITAANIKLAIAAADEDNTTNEKYIIIKPRDTVKTTDYLKNICWIGTMNENEEPIIIQLDNVMNSNGLAFSASSKGRGKVDLVIKAHRTLSEPDKVPYTIYIPKKIAIA